MNKKCNRMTLQTSSRHPKFYSYFLSTLILSLLTLTLQAQFSYKVDGTVMFAGKPLAAADVLLENGAGDVVKETATNSSGAYSLALKPNEEYVIVVSKVGYTQFKILFSTMGFSDDQAKKFKGTAQPPPVAELFSMPEDPATISKINSQTDKPFLSYYYNSDKNVITSDETFEQSVSEQLAKVAKLAGTSSGTIETNYKNAIAKADKAFVAKDYVTAKSAYNEAITIKSSEAYPKTKLTEIDKAIADAAAKEKADKELALANAADKDRLAKEKALADAAAKEKADKDKANAAAAEKDRLAKEKANADALAKEKADKEKSLADAAAKEKADKAEKDRIAKELANADAAAKEKAAQDERDRIAKEKAAALSAEQDRIAKEKALADAALKEKSEKDRIAKELANAEATAKEKAAQDERDRIAKEKAAALSAEQDRIAKEKALADAALKEKADKDKAAAEAAEKERLAKEKEKADLIAKEKAEKEKAIADALEKDRLAKEAEENALPDKYNALISKGDAALVAKDFPAAKTAYTEAQVLKSKETLPAEKLKAVDVDIENAKRALYTNELAKKYPQGLTEEKVKEGNVSITRRIVVQGNKGDLYIKKETSFGAVYYFKNDQAITEQTYTKDTEK
ncbi:MAG: carboxypeptidase regulatory-like domain-containing protein [Bacteroidota bacterium]|nr:carboxypeptidase regulatory-like domain-containing protein [Bacteroidota bacterium]